jgi:hypothetical protein
MLPGFRFLFAAILLSMSILVFGLGAAALLRAAHEEFASNPLWRAAPEANFAQQAGATRPVLAMLRVEPAAEPKPAKDARAMAPPAEQTTNIAPVEQAPTEPAAVAPPPTEPERVAARKPAEPSLPEAAKPEIPALESPAQSEAAPAAADATKVASTEQVLPPANQAVPASSEPASVQVAPDTDAAATKIATLGGPAIAIETPQAKAVSAIADQSAVKKRLQARRAAHRRRLAARARQLQLARLMPQLPPDLFAQPPAAARNQ